MIISLVAAMGENHVIGRNNTLPWGKMPADMKFFKDLTSGHTVIMGRKTYQSFGRPLKNRRNIIITHEKNLFFEGCLAVHSLEEAVKLAKDENEIFIIGGAEIYKQAIAFADKIYLTIIHADFEGDAYFPSISDSQWKETSKTEFRADEKNAYPYAFVQYEKKIVKNLF